MANTTTLQAALEREHRQIDGGIETFVGQIVNGERDDARLTESIEALRRHIYLEEEILFPPLRRAGLVMPLLVMVREHGQIWQAMDHAETLLHNNGSDEELTDACNILLQLQNVHNTKEEPIVYPQADLRLDVSDAAKLAEFMEEGAMPPGWICSALDK